jgi:hypothetical protein
MSMPGPAIADADQGPQCDAPFGRERVFRLPTYEQFGRVSQNAPLNEIPRMDVETFGTEGGGVFILEPSLRAVAPGAVQADYDQLPTFPAEHVHVLLAASVRGVDSDIPLEASRDPDALLQHFGRFTIGRHDDLIENR